MEHGVARRAWEGLMMIVVVLLVVSTVLPLAPGEPVEARVVRGLSTVSVAVALLVAVRARDHAADWELTRPRPVRAVVATLLALLPAAGNGYLTLAQLRSGLVPAAGLLATVAAVVGLATVLVLVLRPVDDGGPRPARSGWRAAVPAVVVGVVLAVGASSVPLAAEAVLVDGTTAPEPVAEATLPESLGRADWTRELAEGVPPRDAAPVAGGLALETDDSSGVVLLDGATGEERWSFHRSGAVVDELVAADDGGLLVVVHGHPPAGPWEATRTWTVLDAATGEVVTGPQAGPPFAEVPGSRSSPSKSASWGGLVAREVALGEGPGGDHTAYDVRTGRELWTCTDCTSLVTATDDAFIVTSDGHLRALDRLTGEHRWTTGHGGCGLDVLGVEEGVVVTRCGTSGDVVGTDVATGEEVWATDLPSSGSYTRPVGVSHGAVNVRTTAPAEGVPMLPLDVTGFDRVTEDVLTVVLDVRTGEPRTQLPAGGYASALAGDVVVIADAETHNAAVAYDVRSGRATPIDRIAAGDEPGALAPADGSLELVDPSCADLADGVHCPVRFDALHVATLGPDGGVSAQRWSDLGVPDGLGSGLGLWTGGWDPQVLLPVPGGTVLAATVRGSEDRQVLVGLVP